MTLAAITCVYGRHDLAELAIARMAALGLPVLAVGSEKKHSRVPAERAGAVYVEHANRPLGAKWNRACAAAIEAFDPEALLIFGSDDFLSALALTALQEKADAELAVGMLDCHVYAAATQQLVYWSGYRGKRKGEPVGTGRILCREVLETLGHAPWEPSAERSLDHSCTQRLASHGIEWRGIRGGYDAVVLGVKGEQQITPFRDFLHDGAELRKPRWLRGVFPAPLLARLGIEAAA